MLQPGLWDTVFQLCYIVYVLFIQERVDDLREQVVFARAMDDGVVVSLVLWNNLN